MIFSLLVLCIVSTTVVADVNVLSPEDKCIANIRKEITDRKVSRNLGGIVGMGWDALTNKPTLPIFATTYHSCRTVPDGDFLIPDNVVVFPIKQANIQKSSQIFDSFSSFKQSDGGKLKVSAGGGVPGIAEVSGSLSVETKIGKEHMEKNSETCFSNTIEYHAFDLIANENAGFDETFLNRLKEIVYAIKDGNPLLAQYEAQRIIGDYGTHVINQALAGASIKMLSFTTVANESQKNSFSLKVDAKFHSNFLGAVSMDMEAEVDHSQESESGSSTTSSQSYIITNGGPDVNRLLGSDTENKMNIDSVVGLTRSGIDLYSVIHRGVLNDTDIDNSTILIVQDMIYNATQEYYRRNTIPGCTDPKAPNYFYKANVDNNIAGCHDDSGWDLNNALCKGFYQECEYVESRSELHPNLTHGNHCDQYRIQNPISEEVGCTYGSESILIGTFHANFKHRTYSVFPVGCNSTECAKNYTITDTIKVTAYYCQMSVVPNGDNGGYGYETYMSAKMGGIFEHENIFSDNGRCADGFDEYSFFHNLKICLGDWFKIDGAKGVIFKGFISCHDEKQECDTGYNKLLVTTIDNCPYYQCVTVARSLIVSTSHNLLKPPYIDRDLAMSKTRFSFQHEIEKLEEEAEEKVFTGDGEEVGVIVS